jgi:hypothetical protein
LTEAAISAFTSAILIAPPATLVPFALIGSQRKSGWTSLDDPTHSPPVILPNESSSRMYS